MYSYKTEFIYLFLSTRLYSSYSCNFCITNKVKSAEFYHWVFFLFCYFNFSKLEALSSSFAKCVYLLSRAILWSTSNKILIKMLELSSSSSQALVSLFLLTPERPISFQGRWNHINGLYWQHWCWPTDFSMLLHQWQPFVSLRTQSEYKPSTIISPPLEI